MKAWYYERFAHRIVKKIGESDKSDLHSEDIAAELRTAISRSYYCAFLTARDLLIEIGYEATDTVACHAVVQKALIKSGESSLKLAASNCATLAAYRRKADYNLYNQEVEEIDKAKDMLKHCETVRNQISMLQLQLTSDLSRKTRIIAAIDAWRSIETDAGIWKKGDKR